jgi:hypothetical protein
MPSFLLSFLPLGVAVSVFAGAAISFETGFRVGQRRAARGDDSFPHLGTIQGAILGLLGLLLGFSFAGASSRYVDQLDIIVDEANAIGTAALRMDLLEPDERTHLRGLFREYTQERVELLGSIQSTNLSAVRQKSEAIQNKIWITVAAIVTERPELGVVLLPPVNDVIDLHAVRMAAIDRHLPFLVLAALLVCSTVALFALGFGCGLTISRHWQIAYTLVLLVATVLWVTIDLDRPRAGLIQLSQQSMLDVLEMLDDGSVTESTNH